MKPLIRRPSRVADSGHLDRSPKDRRPRRSPEVPAGHVPVRVGEEGERFLVRAELLGRPVFLELLNRSAQEYGYGQAGPIRIPCDVALFRRLLRSLLAGAAVEAEVQEP